ncbi:radical SAM protein, partial [bacterium]|nr:radical SAM protein [candidate division CSSED10-310 bacterium]
MNKGNNVLLIWPERDKAFYDFDPIGQIFGEKSLFFPLPLLYVAAALGKEWNYKLVDEGVSHLCDEDIDNADFYLISVNVLQRYSAENTIQRLIPHNKPIIIGGPLISTLDHLFCHSRISKVYGEIEATEASCLDSGLSIAELLASDMRNGAIRNEYHSIGHPDIRQNKLPRYDLVKASGYFNLSMQTSRGCPHHCDFCQQVALYGKHRRKTHQQIIHELDLLLELGQNKTVYITDDNVMGDISTPDKKKEFIELLNSIRIWQERHDYPFDFFTQCSLDIADYEDITELMSKIGLNIMFIGIESIDETALSSVHKQQNLQKDIIAKIRLLQHYGIGIFAGMIIGFDNETNSSVNHQIEFVKQSYIPIVGISILTGFPKTALYRRLQKENRICSDIDALTKSFQTNVITTMHPHDLYDNFLRFTKEIYNPHEYFVRCIAWT